MISQTITVTRKAGLHLRPASELSIIASGCKSSITIIKDKTRLNPKSIINLMNAGINYGDEITIECSGPNEEQDLQTFIKAITGFRE
jgi:phosphocarrier protein HPr